MRTKLLLLLLLPLAAYGADIGQSGTALNQGQMIGGIGADGLFHFLLLANDGSLTVSGGGGGGAVTIADGASVTLGAKADAKSTATDTTAITAMQVLKQISASVQAPPAQAATQSGTWTVQPGNTANTTAWKVDGSAVTQPVSVAAIISIKELTTSSTNGQVTATTSAGTLVAANANRRRLTIRNQDATISVYVGEATVTSANGRILKANESCEITSPELMQVIAASGTPIVDFMDESY